MDFKKKLKIRLYTAIAVLIIGIAMIALGCIKNREMLTSFGLMFFVIGIARIRQYKRITKDDESFRAREIAETDERNVKIWTQARAVAFSVYIFIAAIAVITLYAIDLDLYAKIISYSLLSFIVIYWLCYIFISKKN